MAISAVSGLIEMVQKRKLSTQLVEWNYGHSYPLANHLVPLAVAGYSATGISDVSSQIRMAQKGILVYSMSRMELLIKLDTSGS